MDLIFPEPVPGESWDPHTVHTHYFGFSIPEHTIGVFIYVRAQPYFRACLAGVSVFKGMDNLRPLDCEHNNIVNTVPWPTVEGNVIQIANGMTFDFIEPGNKPTGLEQLMKCTGTLTMHGTTYKVDCCAARDRSIRQVRTEDEVVSPPFGWSPISFGPDFCFNQAGFEDPGGNSAWLSIFPWPKDKPTTTFAWLVRGAGDLRNVVRVKRKVLAYHPVLGSAIEQEMKVEDEKGEVYTLKGQAIAVAQLPAWPNAMFVDSVYRWTDDKGRETHNTYQEAWYQKYWRFWRSRL
ncbi:hypothetical protein N8I77_012253 [Diaporthe amygdali]|uniref:Uncharacterized protein n=1 Tax=Phomopsis amygdali TaxID=1214568 RepID=A0AAD9S4J0_PHOAM|nr:hypothetical protein N8I77_012253 [Diaporthe amygdali]